MAEKKRIMKLSIISDTHGQQNKIGRLNGDVLIHCGDMFNLFSNTNSGDEIDVIDEWFGQQSFDLILCIGGNHDLSLQRHLKLNAQPFSNAIFLNGETYNYQGINFFGSSWVPELQSQAFYADEKLLKDEWAAIPKSTDVLITHTPPFGVLDTSSQGMVLGCKHLAKNVKRIKPTLHCFGHIHASSGMVKNGRTTFINAALAGRGHQLIRDPYIFDLF
ncbi:MAG: Icc-related predicted phosphoesterase [Arenicella sp.]